MSLVSTTIPNLVGGVSQQPSAIRLATQAREQVNGYCSVVEGLKKRPPLRHIARLMASAPDSAFFHTINRSATERYAVVIANTFIRVFDLAGNEKFVNSPDGLAYLGGASPETNFSAVTIEDYTVIVNRNVPVQMGAAVASARPYEAMIWIKQGNYGTSFSITIGSKTGTYTCPTSDLKVDANAYLHIDTSYIAGMLFQSLGSIPNITTQQFGSCIYVRSDQDFYISSADGLGDTAMSYIKGKVQRFTDLPAKAVDGFVVEVSSDASTTGGDPYWVRYTADPNNPNGGTWGECPQPGSSLNFDPATMPHVLVREADGTFTFRNANWSPRIAGDLNVCPIPSFVGGGIRSAFFHRNRLGFTSDENVIFSVAGDFFNFFRASAIQLLDTDPIDISVSNTKASVINHVLPFNETLLLFSEQTQFRLNAADLLTPKSVSINTVTEYPCSPVAEPVGVGQNAYFVFDRGSSAGLREFFVDAVSKTAEATDCTSHAPAYVPANIRMLAACPNENVIVLLSALKRSSLYVYNFYFAGQTKAQSAWHRWDLPDAESILAVSFLDSSLYVVISRPSGLFLEVMDLQMGASDAPATFPVHLDRKVSRGQVTSWGYDTVSDTTSFLVPMALDSGTYQLVSWYSTDIGSVPAGHVVPFAVDSTGNGQTAIRCRGRVPEFLFGRTYEFRYTFSPFQVRDTSGGSNSPAPVTSGRLQIRNLMLNYTTSGYFTVEVTPQARDTAITTFTGFTTGRGTLGNILVSEGRQRVSVQSKNDQVNIDIVNATHLPSGFQSAEWEGFYVLRSKRM